MSNLYLDADACPVKEEAYRVALRHGCRVYVVAAIPMRAPACSHAELVVIAAGPDHVDDWIAETIQAGDICVSDDIPLAARCIKSGAVSITTRGRVLTTANIGEILATRNLMDQLRGEAVLSDAFGGGPSPFSKADRSRFLQSLEQVLRGMKAPG